MKTFLRSLLFPPSPWRQCHVPTNGERLAQYERRLGEHRAQQRLRDERMAQAIDARAIVRPVVTPKLPADNVVNIRKRKTA